MLELFLRVVLFCENHNVYKVEVKLYHYLCSNEQEIIYLGICYLRGN